MTETSASREPFFHRNAWIILLVVSAIFTLFGIGDMVLGMDADPAIAESISGVAWEDLQAASPPVANLINLSSKSLGSSIFFLSVLSIAIILTAFRRGEAWAWMALWIWPLWNASIFILMFTADRSPDFPPSPPMLSAPIFFSISILALVLSYRKFFPGD